MLIHRTTPEGTYTFDTDKIEQQPVPGTQTHCEMIVDNFIKAHGYRPRQTVELTNKRVEEMWGYESLEANQ